MFSGTPGGGCPVVLAARAKLGHIGPLDEIVVKIKRLNKCGHVGKGNKERFSDPGLLRGPNLKLRFTS